ncbi:MAG: glycerophosphodiester phosphodiesterase family protein [Pseudomonadota bacterium]
MNTDDCDVGASTGKETPTLDGEDTSWLHRDDAPWIIGHRGAAGLAPENTLESFARAESLATAAVEFDIQVAHGDLWILHDATLDRTTTLRGALTDQTPNTLAAAGVPTLNSTVAALQPTTRLNVELKGSATGAALARWEADRSDVIGRLLISSFRWEELADYRDAGGTSAVGVLSPRLRDRVLRTAEQLCAWSINLKELWLSRSAVSRVRAAGYACLVYTVNDVQRAQQLQQWGVQGVFTDRPDWVTRAALTAHPTR